MQIKPRKFAVICINYKMFKSDREFDNYERKMRDDGYVLDTYDPVTGETVFRQKHLKCERYEG